MSQMKEQDKTPDKQLIEMKIGNLPEKEFRIIMVKMIQGLGRENEFNGGKDRDNAKKILKKRHKRTKEHTEMNNTITEIKNTLKGINSRITEAEEQISDL